MNSRIFSLLLCCIFTFCGCSENNFDKKSDLIKYINDPENFFRQNKNIHNIDLSIIYQPTDLFVSRYLNVNENIHKKQVDSLREKFSKFLFFKLKISKNNKGLLGYKEASDEFGRLTVKLSYELDECIVLENDKGVEINLYDYSFLRTYGYGDSSIFLLVFERPKSKDLKIKLRNLNIGLGEVVFAFTDDNINKEPILNFNYENE